ncbi:unnamed protein product, partial [Rotaria magnacalcarata]
MATTTTTTAMTLTEKKLVEQTTQHLVNEKNYDNETLIDSDDESNMCHLAVRCPSVSKLTPYDRDNRNRRFTVDTFLAMHGPPGPSGLQGPPGGVGPRGAAGPQGKHIFHSVNNCQTN